MRPSTWHPPVGLSSLEQTIIARIKRAKLFIFLRDHRHELFDDAFQEELATLYPLSSRGHPPLPPAQLELVDCAKSRTLFVRNPEHLYRTLNSRAFMQSSATSNTLEPDNPKAVVAKIERVMSVQETNKATEREPVGTPFACERVETEPVGWRNAGKKPCCSLTFGRELSGFRRFYGRVGHVKALLFRISCKCSTFRTRTVRELVQSTKSQLSDNTHCRT